MNNTYTIENYIKDNPKDAHIKLYTQLLLTTPAEDYNNIAEDDVLQFDLGGIRYNIKLSELKDKVKEEELNYDR